MGGTKKKPLAQAERAQTKQDEPKKDEKKSGKADKSIQQQKLQSITVPKMDDNQIAKVFGGMKAITIYKTAKALNVNASIATTFLKSLESRSTIKRVGGYSGHYIWQFARAG
ncbi:MAG: MarR family transcriptional regulator [Thaumarchaeota archaeon]|nr:MarR family transcriptional regulator [Nitrososphaerota archaeon]